MIDATEAARYKIHHSIDRSTKIKIDVSCADLRESEQGYIDIV
jgi:hypothetical protein